MIKLSALNHFIKRDPSTASLGCSVDLHEQRDGSGPHSKAVLIQIPLCQAGMHDTLLFCYAGLDSSQLAAVALALSSQDIALVHGPPGTGKISDAEMPSLTQHPSSSHAVDALISTCLLYAVSR